MGNYELLTGQIVLGIKLAMPDRVRLLSRVVSEPALWVEVPTQVRPYSSGRVGTDPIVHGLSYVRVGFFSCHASCGPPDPAHLAIYT